ncbi:glycosyltransferase [Clostridium aminobutyricum]|uniref:Glycosyltransferase n=1 Tax=Clostridium aminobutyricum TaxID=33953 RepID=A0A939D9U8_CLOAM|nr:glycosyltransferase [Clostridium aminobutyricum]MBN7773826.1 glycosyltransferase [Clostridium aminobutyricum]
MLEKKKLQSLIFICATISMSVYLLWRLIFTLPFNGGVFALIMGILLLHSEIISALGTFELFWRKNKEFELELPEIPTQWYPHVDVFVATHNEPIELLYNTVNACTFMDYPDKNKVHIYLCDDGNRKEVAALANQLGVGYLGLANNKHAKSGNLNNALSQTKSPLVVTFDADMIPRSSFLMKSVPYFCLPLMKKASDGKWVKRQPEEIDKSYRIGFIQTPQSFYNPDLFQYNLFAERNIPNEQDFFTKEVNVMRNSSNAAAYTGSNTVLARRALEEIGGFPTDTITEDFETGIKIQSLGYTTYATTEVLASGLTPTSIKTMISQRVRWARGVIQSIRNCNVPFNKGLSISARISYMVSHSYWWSFARRIIFTMAPILFALFGVRIAVCGFWDLIAFWGPSHLFYSIAMRSLSSDTRNQRWCQIIDTILAPYLVLPVIMETLGIRQKKFKVTRKNREEREKEFSLHYAIPHLFLLGLSIAALIRFTSGKYGMALIYSSIIIFWLIYNVINLSYAVFFMCGRKIYRKSERFDAVMPLQVSYDNRTLNACTVNVSEGGLAFSLDNPEYIPPDRPISFLVYNHRYRAVFQGFVTYVKQSGSKWYYGVNIQALDAENRRQYMQIVYDRMHSLPTKLNVWISAFDDLANNVSSRMEKQKMDMRALPRIELHHPLNFDDGSRALLVDFNYRYTFVADFSFRGTDSIRHTCTLQEGLVLILEPVKEEQTSSREGLLMKVVNWQELAYHPAFKHLLHQWSDDRQKEKLVLAAKEAERLDL